MDTEPATLHVAFAGPRRLVTGTLPEVLPVLKQRFDADRGDQVLVFDLETGRQVDFDLRGSMEEVLARAAGSLRRGPGRPKLGVTSREVTLLPRHWAWLEGQPSGASATLRRLVEHAMKDGAGAERARRIRAAAGAILTALAGDRPGFEEAYRALFGGDARRLEALVERWPKDIRDLAVTQARAAAEAEAEAAGRP